MKIASGKTHTKINILGIAGLLPALYIFTNYSQSVLALFGAGALFGTFFLSPDLDLKQSASNKAWGGFRWLWYGYHRMFGHRKLSHFVLIGTGSRIIYLALFSILLIFTGHLIYWVIKSPGLYGFLQAQEKTGDIIKQGTLWIHQYRIESLACFAGLVFADALHLVVDLIYSQCRRWKLIK